MIAQASAVLSNVYPSALAGRRSALKLILAELLLLTGCAGTTRQQHGDNGWNGRIALQIEGNHPSFSALFELHGGSEQGLLVLTSPIGTALARLHWTPDYAKLETNQTTQESSSLDSLLNSVIGIDIPIAALFSWLSGQQAYAAGWQVDLSRIKEGQILARREFPLPKATLRISLIS